MIINDEIISGCLICHFKLLDISVQLINSCMAMGSIRDRETNRYLNLISQVRDSKRVLSRSLSITLYFRLIFFVLGCLNRIAH